MVLSMGHDHNTKSFGLILILLVFSAIVSFFPALNSIALYVAMPIAIVISLFKIRSDDFSRILNNRYILLFVFSALAYSSYMEDSLHSSAPFQGMPV